MSVAKLTDQSEFVAGILYCLVLKRFDHERSEDYDSFDALVYWNGYEFVNDDGEVCNDDWDYVVAQSTTPDRGYVSQPQYVFSDGRWIDRAEWDRQRIAKWRADCAARGVQVHA